MSQILNDNKAVIKSWYEAINRGGEVALPTIDELMVPEFAWHSPFGDFGKAAYKSQFGAFLSAFPDLRFAMEDAVCEGDRVVHRFVGTGTHKAEFMGLPATGKNVHYTGIAITRVRDGKQLETWDHFDALTLLQQLGMIPSLT